MSGIGHVYGHVTAEMVRRVLETLQARWELSVSQLAAAERRELLMIVPLELREALTQGDFDLGE
ncbi:hypothetical protein [Spirillospora sp. CA-294931]|uniref:hypothetical protein n=1 Tax=Spirillospora sp. CA-294931 TaxID=3240042 RepID=UPI003D8C1F93